MSLFSEANLEAVGIKLDTKMRLCSVCGISLQYIPDEGYCCPNGHGCWWPRGEEEKIIREHPASVAAGGAVVYKGNSKGRTRKKPPKRNQWVGVYGDS